MPPAPTAEIRPATPADAPAIRHLVRAAYAKWVPLIGREPMPMQVDYVRAVQQHQFALLCQDGALLGLLETIPEPSHLWLENIAVAPEAQGRGHGRRLLAHAEHLAALAGHPEIRLLTNAAFAANVALYQAHGYRIDKQEPFLNGITVFMSKSIPLDA